MLRKITAWTIFVLFMIASVSFAETGKPKIELLADQAFLPALIQALDQTENEVDVLQFSFAIDRQGQVDTSSEPYKIAAKLADLAAKGKKVRVYIEATRDTAARNRFTADWLSQRGVEVKYGATHAKGYRIDNTIITGSHNNTIQSIRYNNETSLLVRDHIVSKEFRNYFESLWNGEPRSDSRITSGDIEFLTNGLYKESLLQLFANAERSIDISIYYFSEKDLEEALIKAANRGVKIRIYINTHDSFATHLVERNKATIEQLNAAGITETYFDLPTMFSHSKYAIADNKTLLLGTGNWNHADIHTHPQLYLQVKDSHIAATLSAHLSQQIAYESSRPISPRIYHRFWIGWQRPEINLQDFDSVIENIFVDATIATGQGLGLHSYIPVLVAGGGDVTVPLAQSLPAEVALVSYNDIETYRAIRETPSGSVYGPLHGDYFDLRQDSEFRSGSTVPQAYEGQAVRNQAYDFSEEKINVQQLQMHFTLTQRVGDAEQFEKGMTGYLNSIKEIQTEIGLVSYLVLIKDEYIIEYIGFKNEATYNNIGKLAQLRHETGVLSNKSIHDERTVMQNPGSVQLGRPGAINLRFDHEIKAEEAMTKAQNITKLTAEDLKRLKEKIKKNMLEGRALDECSEQFSQGH